MKSKLLLFGILCIGLGSPSCSDERPVSASTPPDFAALVDTFNAAMPYWRDAVRQKDVSYIVDLYAEDAVFIPPGEATLVGREQIRSHWQNLAQVLDDFSYQSQRISGSADVFYESGLAFATYTLNEQQVTDTSKYLLVWKRIGPDQYRIIADTFNAY